MQPSSIDALLSDVAAWAKGDPRIEAVALVGSYARGSAQPDSDVDLVILSAEAASFVEDTRWAARFGNVRRQEVEEWGAVTSVRVHYEAGSEVEFGFAGPAWASQPVDPGTRRVVRRGMRVISDRSGLLRGLQVIAGDPNHR